jgi:hypothetical protein
MTGDLTDIIMRLKSVLPKRWFSEQSPNLTAIIKSIAVPWAWLYSSLNYVIRQTRIASATDGWLDVISLDYFGDGLRRKSNETDTSYRTRIQRALLREAATRCAVGACIKELVGAEPRIFEPSKCSDTGSYATLAGASGVSWSGLEPITF